MKFLQTCFLKHIFNALVPCHVSSVKPTASSLRWNWKLWTREVQVWSEWPPWRRSTRTALRCSHDFHPPPVYYQKTQMVMSWFLFQVHYDGWSNVYDEWVDSDHPDIHPAGWCDATGHPLKIPPRDTKTQQSHGSIHHLALKETDVQIKVASLALLSTPVCICSGQGASCYRPGHVPFFHTLQTHKQPQNQVQLPQQVWTSSSSMLLRP